MAIRLEVISKERHLIGRQSSFETEKTSFLIGRAPHCDWIIEDPARYISSEHARITRKSDGFYITDLSSNGTFRASMLVGKNQESPIPLESEEVITFGMTKILIQLVDRQDKTIVHLHEQRVLKQSIEDAISQDHPFLDHGQFQSKIFGDFNSRQQNAQDSGSITQIQKLQKAAEQLKKSAEFVENPETTEDDYSQKLDPSRAFNVSIGSDHSSDIVDLLNRHVTEDPFKAQDHAVTENAQHSNLLSIILTHLMHETQIQLASDRIKNPSRAGLIQTTNPFLAHTQVEQTIEALGQASSEETLGFLQEVMHYLSITRSW